MDQQKQPTEEMLAEARRLAFFADEILSQDIMNSYEKTDGYIKRHTQQLLEDGVIKESVVYSDYTEEEVKAYNKWFNSLLRKTVYFPVLVYLLTSWYFISIPMEDWVLNLAQYNPPLLERFPKAQYWVNISTQHREKMIVLYIIFKFSFWLILTLVVFSVFLNIKKLTVDLIPTKNKICQKKSLLFTYGFFLLGLASMSFFGVFSFGSEIFLIYSELDNSARQWLLRENSSWNSAFGFLVKRSLDLMLLGFGLLGAVRVGAMVCFCKKNKIIK